MCACYSLILHWFFSLVFVFSLFMSFQLFFEIFILFEFFLIFFKIHVFFNFFENVGNYYFLPLLRVCLRKSFQLRAILAKITICLKIMDEKRGCRSSCWQLLNQNFTYEYFPPRLAVWGVCVREVFIPLYSFFCLNTQKVSDVWICVHVFVLSFFPNFRGVC